jgi:hypothetical protein
MFAVAAKVIFGAAQGSRDTGITPQLRKTAEAMAKNLAKTRIGFFSLDVSLGSAMTHKLRRSSPSSMSQLLYSEVASAQWANRGQLRSAISRPIAAAC